MAIIAELAVLITANTGAFSKNIGAAGAAISDLATKLSLLSLARKALDFSIDQTIKDLGDLEKLGDIAQQLGDSFENIQGLELLGRTKGIEIDQFSLALNKMQIKLAEAAAGSQEAQAAFRRLSLDEKSLQVEGAVDGFKKIADALKQLPTRTQQAAAAQDIFGKSSRNLLEAIDLGSAGIDRYLEKARDLSSVTGEDAQRASEFKESLGELSTAIDLVSRSITVSFLPQLEKTRDFLKQFAGANALAIRGLGEAVNGVKLPANVSEFQKVLDANAKAFEDFVKRTTVSGATIPATQKRIDDLTGKIEELGRSSKIEVAPQIAGFQAESQKISEAYNATLKSIQAAGPALADLSAKQAKLLQDINTIEAELAALRTSRFTPGAGRLDLIDLLQEEVQQMLAENDRLNAAMAAQQQRLKELGKTAQDQVGKLGKLEQKTRDFTKAAERAAKHTLEFRTPLEKLKEDIGELKEEFDLGLIGANTLRRGMAKLSEEFVKSRQSFSAIAGSKEAFKIENDFLTQSRGIGNVSAIAERIIGEKRLRDAAAESAKIFNAIVQSTAGIRANLVESAAAMEQLNASALAQRLQRVPTRDQVLGRLPLEAPPVSSQSLQRVPTRQEMSDRLNLQRVPTREEMNESPVVKELREHGKLLRESLRELRDSNRSLREQATKQPKVQELSTIP